MAQVVRTRGRGLEPLLHLAQGIPENTALSFQFLVLLVEAFKKFQFGLFEPGVDQRRHPSGHFRGNHQRDDPENDTGGAQDYA